MVLHREMHTQDKNTHLLMAHTSGQVPERSGNSGGRASWARVPLCRSLPEGRCGGPNGSRVLREGPGFSQRAVNL